MTNSKIISYINNNRDLRPIEKKKLLTSVANNDPKIIKKILNEMNDIYISEEVTISDENSIQLYETGYDTIGNLGLRNILPEIKYTFNTSSLVCKKTILVELNRLFDNFLFENKYHITELISIKRKNNKFIFTFKLKSNTLVATVCTLNKTNIIFMNKKKYKLTEEQLICILKLSEKKHDIEIQHESPVDKTSVPRNKADKFYGFKHSEEIPIY